MKSFFKWIYSLIGLLRCARNDKAACLTGLLRLCLAMTLVVMYAGEVYALQEGQVVFDFKEDDKPAKASFMENVAKSLEIWEYFEKNYPDKKIEESFVEDLEAFFPDMEMQRLYNTQSFIRFGIKAYRFVNQIIDEYKSRMIAPEPPPLTLDDSEYEKEYTKPYVESDELVVIPDFKKVISYSTDPKEIIAYTDKVRRDMEKVSASPIRQFFKMLSNVEVSKLPFYNIFYDSPITGRNGSGDWVMSDEAGARILTYNSTINGEEMIKGAINFTLPDASAVLAYNAGDYERIKFDFSKSKNLKGYSIFYPAPIRNQNVFEEQIIGYSGFFAVPVIFEVEDVTEPLEINAEIEFALCDSLICKKMKLSPKIELAAGDGYISAYSNYVLQSFNALPNIDSKDIKLVKHFVSVPLSPAEPQSLYMEFEVASVSRMFDVFVSEQIALDFLPPVVSMDGKKVSVLMQLKDKSIDLRGRELTVVARLDYGQPLQTFIVAKEDIVFGAISKNLTISILIAALLAGLVASLMPAVLPLILIEGIRLKKQSLKVVAAIFGSMLLISGLIVGARALGYSLGFGMHLQSPIFAVVLFFAAFVYLLKVSNIIKLKLSPYAAGVGVVLGASVFGFPYMSSSMGAAMSYGWVETLAVMTVMGVGLSIPWVLIKAAPGIDMDKSRIRKYMVLMLFFALFWIFLIIAAQVSGWAVFRLAAYSLILFLALGFRKLFNDEVENSELDEASRNDVGKRFNRIFAIAAAVLVVFAAYDMKASFDKEQNLIVREKIDLDTVQDYIKKRKSVLVIVEAKWCLSCKYNDFMVLNKYALGELLRQKEIDIIRVDWSDFDKKVLEFMEIFDKRSVPFYILFTPKYPGGIILPEIMDQRDMEKIIKNVT